MPGVKGLSPLPLPSSPSNTHLSSTLPGPLVDVGWAKSNKTRSVPLSLVYGKGDKPIQDDGKVLKHEKKSARMSTWVQRTSDKCL